VGKIPPDPLPSVNELVARCKVHGVGLAIRDGVLITTWPPSITDPRLRDDVRDCVEALVQRGTRK
jgi:hypothetical protein